MLKKMILTTLVLTACLAFFAGCQRYTIAQGELEPIPTFDPPEPSPKIALVLGGGGSKGIAHVGVLRELNEAGIHPDLIVGCSSGALIGALYADQPDVKRLERMLIELKKSDLLDFSLFASPYGMVKGYSIQNFILQHIKADDFDSLEIPLVVVATDLLTGEVVELGGGPLLPALCSSAAVPGVFKPVSYLGRYLVDGGASDPVPARIAKKYGAKIIIAVDVGEKLTSAAPYHLFGIAKRGMNITYRQLSLHAARGADVVIRLNFQGLGMFSDQYNQQIYEAGRAKTREVLPQIEALVSDRLTPFPTESAPSWLTIE